MMRTSEDVRAELENAKLAADRCEKEYNEQKEGLQVDPCSLATKGIHMCELLQIKMRLEREHAKLEDLSNEEKSRQFRHLESDYLSVGADMWEHVRARVRLSDPAALMFAERATGSDRGEAWSLMSLYARANPIPIPPRPLDRDTRAHYELHPRQKFPSEILQYYNAKSASKRRKRGVPKGAKPVWCHYPGCWGAGDMITAMQINPLNLIANGDEVGELVCGRSDGPENYVLINQGSEGDLDNNRRVIIPADPSNETGPVIKRWRVDDVRKRREQCHESLSLAEIEATELRFRNSNRPAASFMFLRFMLTLVAIRNQPYGSSKWEHIWASYYQEEPFPNPPGAYVRTCFLRAIADYFGPTTFTTADMKVIESFMTGDSGNLGTASLLPPLVTTKHEEREVARRFHMALMRLERRWGITEEYDSDYDSGPEPHDELDYCSLPSGPESESDSKYDASDSDDSW